MKLCRACHEVAVLKDYCAECDATIQRDTAIYDAERVRDQMVAMSIPTDHIDALIKQLGGT